MRHKKLLGKLGRDTAHRQALHRNMVTQLIQHERIITTHPKAKVLKTEADRVIRWGKSVCDHFETPQIVVYCIIHNTLW